MSEFITQSQEALQSFLNTAVVIDDRIYEKVLSVPQKVDTPTRRSGYTNGGYTNSSKSSVQNENSPSVNYIDHKSLTRAFLEKQILCTLIEPDSELMQSPDTLYKNIESAFNADIVILDWKLKDDEELTKSLIERRIEKTFGNALQLICIYTSESDLSGILEKIVSLNSDKISQTPEEDTILKCGNTYFIAVQKNQEKECELPEILIDKFSKVTSGLLPNAVLASFAAIRENTHAVISKFSKKMDPAYITHRILSDPIDETQYHIHPLICDEILAILEDSKAIKYLSPESIQSYCENKITFPINIKENLSFTQESFNELILKGLCSDITPIPLLLKHTKDFKNLISGVTNKIFQHSQLSDNLFANLTLQKSNYYNTAPTLKGGCVVKTKIESEEKYFLCIQPQCDSVRLNSSGCNFSFLRLKKVESETKNKFDILFFEKDELIFLEILYKESPYVEHFVPDATRKCVLANTDEANIYFMNDSECKYLFIAQLKDLHTQRIVHKYANHISRVGLTESEWLRRCSPK